VRRRLLHGQAPLQVRLGMYPLPCLQGRARVGSLFDTKIKSFTPSQPPPASRGRSNVGSLEGLEMLAFFARHSCEGRKRFSTAKLVNPMPLLMRPLDYSLRSPLWGRSLSVLRASRLSCLRRNDGPGDGLFDVEPQLAVQARRTESEQYRSIRQFVRVVRAVAGEVLPQ
jgi:hypothetical protein